MAKISKEEIRKRLQQKKKKTEPKPEAETKEDKKRPEKKQETTLSKDLKYLGIVTAGVIALLIFAVVLKEKTSLLDQVSSYLFQLLHLS